MTTENQPAEFLPFDSSPLLVIDQLIIGPPAIAPQKISVPYRVWQNGKEETQDLIYKFEEAVFDPTSPSDQNLASMIGAQLALNYGLFCRKITFDGSFDHTDQRFLKNMMENTSREILVKKIYEPNVFLQGPIRELPVQKRGHYTLAAVEFINTCFEEGDLHWTYWPTDRHKHCVLSSGGKDSLLSYSLLKEIGQDVHPIFGNESGRHWFTALNGYRHLKATEPNTARVWMNTDRMFAWMLRRLPFVRPDFAHIRSDDYPIRLWTVALFLFGVLPLLKKRGIGRLVIGDEYDSTQRGNFHGITHYNGYYDQSRFFDEALSRYFLKKGWSVSQFSLLRPLSELMIQKILALRYPDLQRHQTSCHATHEHEGRIYPCGKCEKCRRIVGMLTALDADPRHCGYTDEQIEQALQGLTSKKVKQLGSDASHLYYLLGQKGVLKTGARSHPEIMQLRFDKERSPLRNIPTDLRVPVYSIFLEYSNGSVHRENRQWEPFNLLDSRELYAPYPFEMETTRSQQARQPGSSKPKHPKSQILWGHLTWEEAAQRTREVDTALLPVGAIEQHGLHLPLDVDAFDADYLALKVAEACSDPKPLVLPLVPYGVSYHHDDFAGTISISNEAMAKFIYDIGMSAARNGIKKLIIINGHGDNAPTLNYAAQMINRDSHIFVCIDTGETSDADLAPLTSTPNDIHAGEVETSTTLAVRPELVKMDKAQESTLHFSNRYLNFSSKNYVPWYVHTHKISRTGVMGDPTLATAEKGRRMWEIMISHLVAFVEAIKGLPLEEIYQRKY